MFKHLFQRGVERRTREVGAGLARCGAKRLPQLLSEVGTAVGGKVIARGVDPARWPCPAYPAAPCAP